MTSLTTAALAPLGIGKKDAERSKNMSALGPLAWMYSRPTGGTERWLREKVAKLSCRRSPRPIWWRSRLGTPMARDRVLRGDL
jgi:hypothetical protein